VQPGLDISFFSVPREALFYKKKQLVPKSKEVSKIAGVNGQQEHSPHTEQLIHLGG